MTQYVEVFDTENPTKPKNENIAKELDKIIAEIEQENNVELVTFCFLGEEDVLMKGETEFEQYAIEHDKVHKYMVHFR